MKHAKLYSFSIFNSEIDRKKPIKGHYQNTRKQTLVRVAEPQKAGKIYLVKGDYFYCCFFP